MTICEELRQAVLQAAIQGKLTEQREEDGTAEELLEEIRKEKEKLIKDGKIKKEKKLPEIDEVPFDIPESWKWCRIGSVSDMLSGYAFKSEDYQYDGGHKLLRGINLGVGSIHWEDVVFVKHISKDQERFKLLDHDVLLGLDRPWISGGTRVAIVSGEEDTYLVQRVLRIRETTECYYGYIWIILVSNLLEEYIGNDTTGISVPHISQNQVGALMIPLPPLAEQHRIVERVNTLMKKIDALQTIEDELQSLKQSFPVNMRDAILQAAMQGRLTEQLESDGTAEELLEEIKKEKEKLIKEGKIKKEKKLPEISEDEIPFDIPENWKWVRLGDLISYQNGYAYKSSDMTNHGFPVIKSGNLMTLEVVIKPNNDYISNPTEKMLSSKIVKGDMLMCLSSQSNNPEPLGKTAIYCFDEPALLNQRVLKMRPYDNRITKYLYYAINSEYFHYTVSHQGGGSAQANLKLEHVLNMLMPIPPLKEQERIIHKIQSLMPYYDTLRKKMDD